MPLTTRYQFISQYDTNYTLPILLLVWHRLHIANPFLSITLTTHYQSLSQYDTNYTSPIPLSVWLHIFNQSLSLCQWLHVTSSSLSMTPITHYQSLLWYDTDYTLNPSQYDTNHTLPFPLSVMQYISATPVTRNRHEDLQYEDDDPL